MGGFKRTPRAGGFKRTPRAGGFTLLELLIVLAIFAVAAGSIALALRDPAQSRLEREAERLAALLEAARAEARASGLAVRWIPAVPGGAAADGVIASGADFRFTGLPPRMSLPSNWLAPGVAARVEPGPDLRLGPEPVIPAQRITLTLEQQHLRLETDGLRPFALAPVMRSAP